jgi:hypothetical protein
MNYTHFFKDLFVIFDTRLRYFNCSKNFIYFIVIIQEVIIEILEMLEVH